MFIFYWENEFCIGQSFLVWPIRYFSVFNWFEELKNTQKINFIAHSKKKSIAKNQINRTFSFGCARLCFKSEVTLLNHGLQGLGVSNGVSNGFGVSNSFGVSNGFGVSNNQFGLSNGVDLGATVITSSDWNPIDASVSKKIFN